jgi:hypothetical protein
MLVLSYYSPRPFFSIVSGFCLLLLDGLSIPWSSTLFLLHCRSSSMVNMVVYFNIHTIRHDPDTIHHSTLLHCSCSPLCRICLADVLYVPPPRGSTGAANGTTMVVAVAELTCNACTQDLIFLVIHFYSLYQLTYTLYSILLGLDN